MCSVAPTATPEVVALVVEDEGALAVPAANCVLVTASVSLSLTR